jgi:DNA-binding NarL/FixJ family response regulator
MLQGVWMIRVIIADQRLFMVDSIRILIDKQKDMHFVGCASKVEELHSLLPQCDVALICPNFVSGNIYFLINELHSRYPGVKLIPLELPDKPSTILKYLEVGSVGYLLKEEGSEDVVVKIRAAMDGRALVSDKIAAEMMNRIWSLANSSTFHLNKQKDKITLLTPRQQEIIELVCQGLTNQDIARQLVIETGTVKNHIHNILKKINASNRQEAAILYELSLQANGALRHDNGTTR